MSQAIFEGGVRPGEHEEGVVTKQIEQFTSQVPSGLYLGLAIGSIGLSALLYARGRKADATFVGLLGADDSYAGSLQQAREVARLGWWPDRLTPTPRGPVRRRWRFVAPVGQMARFGDRRRSTGCRVRRRSRSGARRRHTSR